jgi:hypothetical protein
MNELCFEYPHKWDVITPLFSKDISKAAHLMQENHRALEDYICTIGGGSGGATVLTSSMTAASQSVTNNTSTLLDMTASDIDALGIVDLSTDKMTTTVTGIYLTTFHVYYSSDNTTGVREAATEAIPTGGDPTAGDSRVAMSGGTGLTIQTSSTVRLLTAGTVVGLYVRQTSGGSRGIGGRVSLSLLST